MEASQWSLQSYFPHPPPHPHPSWAGLGWAMPQGWAPLRAGPCPWVDPSRLGDAFPVQCERQPEASHLRMDQLPTGPGWHSWQDGRSRGAPGRDGREQAVRCQLRPQQVMRPCRSQDIICRV